MSNRKYATSATMLHDKLADKVVQPDLKHVETLHRLLDMVPSDSLAFAIDMIVADLIRFHNPPNRGAASLTSPEIIMPKEKVV